MPVKTLTELANQYGTDKGTVEPRPNWGSHNYTDIYSAYLERHRFAPLNILEIGLGVLGDRWDSRIVHGRNSGGASLKMWYDYFPNASIYGIDVNECSYLNNERVKTFVADQGSPAELAAFLEAAGNIQFDVIIDDGSHRPDHQQISFSFLFESLKPGGLYFIEDLWSVGHGDGATGRHACDEVANTRRVLKHFREHGTFLEPNALIQPDKLAGEIAYINFHRCQQGAEVKLRPSMRRPFKKMIRHKPDTELLCAIEKKADR
jgi:hypothetical protein